MCVPDGCTGITTAASLLMVAAIGIASGLGFYLLATVTTVLTLVVLGLLRRLEKRLGTVEGSRPEDRSATD